MLVVAGGVGVVKVINIRTQKVAAVFSGHGDVPLSAKRVIESRKYTI